MSDKAKAILLFIFYNMLFAVLPRYLVNYLSENIRSIFPDNIIPTLTIIGIIFSVCIFIKYWFMKFPWVSFIAILCSEFTLLAFSLYVYGLGNILSFGKSSEQFTLGGQTIEIFVNLRLFVITALVIIVLKVFSRSLKFYVNHVNKVFVKAS